MALWTPADSTVQPLLMMQDADAVWSGTTLASIVNSGSEGGSFSIYGTPDQGTAMHGHLPIRFNASSEALYKTLDFPNTGQVSVFYYDKLIAANASFSNGIINRAWNAGTTNNMFLTTSNEAGFGGGSWMSANRNGVGPADNAPVWESTTNFQTAGTTNSVYAQAGTTNDAWVDSVQQNLTSTVFGADLPKTGAVPDYASFAWEFGRGVCEASTSPNYTANSEFLCIALFSSWLATDERNRWEGYWHWRGGTQAQLPASHPFRSAAPTNGTDIMTFGVSQDDGRSFTQMIGY